MMEFPNIPYLPRFPRLKTANELFHFLTFLCAKGPRRNIQLGLSRCIEKQAPNYKYEKEEKKGDHFIV